MIYLDNAATTLQKPPGVANAVRRAIRSMASPGRGGHLPSMRAAETLYACRAEAAELFHVPDPERVVFTMNATHGLNLALHSLVRPGDRVLISGFEHNSVTRPLHALGAEIVPVARKLFSPQEALADFARYLEGANFVVCTHVSNVFGYILPIEEIAELCKKRKVPLIVDASQSAGILDVDMGKLGAAFVAMPGHKALMGPQGTGILLCGEHGIPLMQGGSGSDSLLQQMPDYLPDRLEAGTPNVCGIAGLLEGIRYVKRIGCDTIFRHEKRLLQIALQALKGADITCYSGDDQCGVLSVRCPHMDSESLASELAKEGVCVRGGLHCAPFAHESAGTLPGGTVRFSFSAFTSVQQVLQACRILRRIV